MWFKTLVLLEILALSAICRSQESGSSDVTTEWISQKLDHFDESETRTWKMRYMVNRKYYVEGGPLFVINGIGQIFESILFEGPIAKMAEEHHAFLIFIENRYNGESLPTSDLSISNLRYLSLKQIVEDIANAIRTVKAENSGLSDAKVLAFGRSTLGSLVALTQSKYPDLIYGGWVASGTFFGKLDLYETFEITSKALLDLGSQECYDRVKGAIVQAENMLTNDGPEEVKSTLNLCDNFDTHNNMDVYNLFNTILFYIGSRALSRSATKQFCDLAMAEKDDISTISAIILKDSTCKDMTYASFLRQIKNETNFRSLRITRYMNCNEFGWMPTTSSSNQILGTKLPMIYHTTMCSDVFGEEYTESFIEDKIQKFNEYFGGKNPPNVNNFYFTYGEYDIAKFIGIDPSAFRVRITPHACHAEELRGSNSNDATTSLELVAEYIRTIMT